MLPGWRHKKAAGAIDEPEARGMCSKPDCCYNEPNQLSPSTHSKRVHAGGGGGIPYALGLIGFNGLGI